MAAGNRKYLYLSTGLRYLRNSKGYKKVFMDVELSGPSDGLVRGWSIPGRIMEFKMAAVNRKYLYLSTGLKYLRNSKAYKNRALLRMTISDISQRSFMLFLRYILLPVFSPPF